MPEPTEQDPVDLDDTSGCPCADVCATCDRTDDGLSVATADTTVGVMCFTLCGRCADHGWLPASSWSSWSRAAALAGEHTAHLGIDVDTMAAVRDGERR